MSVVHQLVVSNLKRVEALSVDLHGAAVVRVEGDNGAGKTSCLDAFEALVARRHGATWSGAAPRARTSPRRSAPRRRRATACLGR